jgi:hypothetical protein
MHAVVDEITDPQLSTDQGSVFPLQAEMRMIWLNAGA